VAASEPVPRPAAVRRRIVVMGASAGGVEALATIAGGLPADLDAAVFIVLHMPEGYQSSLSEILDRAGPLPARAAVEGQPVTPGTITDTRTSWPSSS